MVIGGAARGDRAHPDRAAFSLVLADRHLCRCSGSASISCTAASRSTSPTSRRPRAARRRRCIRPSFYLGQAIGPVVYGYRLRPWRPGAEHVRRRRGGDRGRSRVLASACGIRHGSIDAGRAVTRQLIRTSGLVHRQPKSPMMRHTAWGAAADAAEIKPIEPVWVIPAKGAAGCRTSPHAAPKRRTSPSSAPASSVWASPGGWPRAARRSTVFDRGAAGSGASHAAAGMLAACAEAEPGEEALVALGRASQARWPAFAAELQQASGIDVELRREGTLVVALTADDQARLQHQLALPAEARACRWNGFRRRRRAGASRILPASSPARCCSPQDHQVDNRKLAAALRVAAERRRRAHP